MDIASLPGPFKGICAAFALSTLAACSTTGGGQYTPVGDPIKTQSRDSDCGFVSSTSQRYQTPTDEEKLVELSKTYKFDDRCGDLNVLAIVAKTELNTPEGALASSAVLLALTGKNESIKALLRQALSRNDINEDALHQRVAKDFIASQVNIIRKPGGGPNLPVVATLLDLYREDELPKDKRRFPDVNIDILRNEIDTKLQQTGLSIDALEQVYISTFKTQQPVCVSERTANGSRTRCHQPEGNAGHFILDQPE